MRGRTWLMLDVLTNLFQTCSWFKTNGYKLITNTKVFVWGAILHKARIYSNVGRISTTAPLTPQPPTAPTWSIILFLANGVENAQSCPWRPYTTYVRMFFFSFSFWTIFVIGSNTTKPNTRNSLSLWEYRGDQTLFIQKSGKVSNQI